MCKKKLWNQMLSILLVFALLPVSALAELRPEDTAHPDVVNEFTASVSHVNPEYARLGVKFPRPAADCLTMAETTVDTLEEAAEYLRGQMEARVTDVAIVIPDYQFVDGDTMNADWSTILYGAFAHTGVPTQGDYILRHYGKCAGNLQYSSKVGATFSYTITYDTTQNQENKVEEKIDELFTAWDAECGFYDLSDYEQVKVIYDYICENVVYDYDNLLNLNYTLKYSAYAALINGTAVCQGYANLFYRMALEAGIDTRIIVGDGGGPHSWNIVDLGEKYYYLDATWDAPRAEKDYPYEYFLLGSDNFCLDHTPEADNVLDCDVTTYPIDTADYDPDTALLTEATEAGLLRYFDTVTMDTELTRLAAAKLIVALAELELDSTATLPFEDCAGLTEEEQQIIATVCQAGLMTGYDATTFQPANTLTRAMVALILYRAMNGGVDDEDIWDYADDGYFSDVANSTWYSPYVNYLASIGVIPTSEDGKFYPNDTAIFRSVLRWAVDAVGIESEKPENPDKPEIPEDAIASGECGENLIWYLTEDGTLTISGEGEMYNYRLDTLPPWDNNKINVISIVIENGVTCIGDYAFYGCPNLANITIPDSVTYINSWAFYDCINLASVTIPDSVTTIDYAAFFGCNNLSSISIPDSVTHIGSQAFYGCTSLTSVTIPDSVTKVYTSTFKGCTSLASISISNSVTSIDDDAFYGCTSLTSVTIPDSVTYIGYSVFSGCTSLTNITLGNGLQSIYDSAFSNCASLTSITIPDSVTYIYSYAFSGCTGLTSVIIGNSVTTISEAVFKGCTRLTSVSLGSSITTISKDVFRDCVALTGITLPESCTEIGESAFYGCTSLETADLGGTTTIGANALRNCTALVSVTLSENLTSIGNYAFKGCDSLATVCYGGTEEQWNAINFGSNNESLRDAEIIFEGEAIHTHTEEIIPAVAPTCTEDGLTEGTKCATCGEILVEQEVIPATGHTSTAWIHDDENHWHECSVCGEMFDVAAHEWEEVYRWENCWEPGGVIYDCTICLHEIIVELPQAPHTEVIIPAVPATCTESGWTEGVMCSECEEILVEQEVIPATGHSEEVISGYDATCTDDGLTDGVQCSICGEILVAQEVIPAKGHTEEAIHGYDATCTEDGLTDGTECSICGEVLVEQEVIPAKGHIDENGDYICDNCGENLCTEHIEEIIHGYDATCTDDGLTDGVQCSICGEILVAQEVIPAKGHTEEAIHGYDATCTEDGLTDGMKCSVCGEMLVEQEIILATGHTEEVISGYDATCTEDGLTDGTKCSTCGEVLVTQEIIPAKGHTEEVIYGYDATCTEDGLTDGAKCSVCGAILVEQEVIPATGHTEEVISGYDATCTEDGLTDGTECSICGEILVAQEVIPAKGHSEEVIPGYPATLTASGLTDGVMCSVCGEILVAQEEIPALTEISGTCGENLTWTLTNEGVLTISGEGAMYNFTVIVDLLPLGVVPMNEETAVLAPWSDYTTLIAKVVVEDGVTSIGNNAFAACENLKEIEIPETVTAIGDNVFTGCEALETVTYTGSEEQWAEITHGEGNEALEDVEIVIKDVVLGDVNEDGSIDSIDLSMLYDYAMGWLTLTEDQIANGDIDGDLSISSTDVAILYDYLMGWNHLLD